MSKKYEKLKALLKELFQLDQPDLDFGLYRIMHAKSAEVSQFLDQDLLPQVKHAFAEYKAGDTAELEKQLAKLVASIEAAGMNPEESPKVAELRAQLTGEAVDVGQLESEVYDHLFSFFRRYYSEGDFLSKRVYKPGVYAIPYEGEEVKLHWANADQYYIKTSEYLRDYAFRLRPDDAPKPMRVHFRLVDVAEGEHGNVKASAGKDRRFKLAESSALAVENDELIVRFTYLPDPAKQKDLNAAAEEQLLASDDPALADWLAALRAKHQRTDGTESENTRLRVHLDRYTARNTFDYFIHKDLGGFLRRELDFYIKNEVMHLDDIENESAPRVEQYLSKIKVIRKIAAKIIDFLAQLEDFQKKLWLKKKFVVETSWCIRVGVIPEEFYAEIAANEAQCEEWVKLCAIDDIEGDLATPGYHRKLKGEFLSAHPTLVVDTRHYGGAFTARLLDAMGDLDPLIDGVLFDSENYQALGVMQQRYAGCLQCVYIDPPYNTGSDFAYKDSYQHSSWVSLISDRAARARSFASPGAVFFCSIADRGASVRESQRLVLALDQVFGASQFLATLVWVKGKESGGDASVIGNHHEYIVMFAMCDAGVVRLVLDPKDTSRHQVALPEPNRVVPGELVYRRGEQFQLINLSKQKDYRVRIPLVDGEVLEWDSYCPQSTVDEYVRISRMFVGAKGVPYVKSFLADEKPGTQPGSLLEQSVGTTKSGGIALRELFGDRPFEYPKPPSLIARLAKITTAQQGFVLDYFAGSGTTGHAIVNLNREDGGERKFILVEMGAQFDSVLLPRLKKVAFTPEWKDGAPHRLATAEEAERSPRIMKVVRLESYEDALNNLEPRRSKSQGQLLLSPDSQGADGFKEQYILRYMLDVETRGSQSLLNVQAFTDPTAYKLKVKRPGSDESREVNVDLLETFNWLIGLTVQHLAAPRVFSAAFERDSEGRLRLKGRLKQDAEGPYWFRTVTGTTPDGRRALVIWRKLTGNPDEDNLVLDEWFTRQGYSSKDSEFDLIYVNGGNNLENLKAPDDLWKVRLIEEDFHRLMFESEGA